MIEVLYTNKGVNTYFSVVYSMDHLMLTCVTGFELAF